MVFSSICDVARNLASLVSATLPICTSNTCTCPRTATVSSPGGLAARSWSDSAPISPNILAVPSPPRPLHGAPCCTTRCEVAFEHLYEHRRRHPTSIAAASLYAVIQAGTRMMPEDYLPLLRDFRDEIRITPVRERDGVKVVIEGAFLRATSDWFAGGHRGRWMRGAGRRHDGRLATVRTGRCLQRRSSVRASLTRT